MNVQDWVVQTLTQGGNRLPAVVTANGEPITGDQRLIDASLLALVAADLGNSELTRVALRARERFNGSALSFVPSSLDANGGVGTGSSVIHGFDQALWLLSLTRLTDGEEKSVSEPRPQGPGFEVTDSMGRTIVPERRLATAAVWTLIDAEEHRDSRGSFLDMFWVEGRFWDKLDAQGRPIRALGSSTHDLSWTLLACQILGDHDPDWVRRREDTTELLLEAVLPHAWHRGVWSWLDESRQVATSAPAAVGRQDVSPFPAVFSADQALIEVALRNVTSAAAKALKNVAHAALDTFIGSQGNVALGRASWFSTPTDPTVPLGRLVSPTSSFPGAFYVGRSSYVQMHSTHAYSQCAVLWARPTETRRELTDFAAPVLGIDELEQAIQVFPDEATEGEAAPPPGLDVEAYLGWLSRTRTENGFGLSPYVAPLGLRPDRTAQTFSLLHVLADLAVLGRALPNTDWVKRIILSCANHDGGFGESPGHPSEVFTTYCAVISAKISGIDLAGQAKTVSFLQSAQHESGGFGNNAGAPADTWHTNLAVLGLVALGAKPNNPGALHGFLHSVRNSDGGFGEEPGSISDVFATFRALGTLRAIGAPVVGRDATIAYIANLQHLGGGFHYREGAPVSFVGTYHAIAALYAIGAPLKDADACRKYLLERQQWDGGFGRTPGGQSETTDEGFIAVQGLHMLQGNLNPLWALMVT